MEPDEPAGAADSDSDSDLPSLGESSGNESCDDGDLSDDGCSAAASDDDPEGELFAASFRAIMARGAGAHPEQPEQPAEQPAGQLAEQLPEQPADQPADGLPRDPPPPPRDPSRDPPRDPPRDPQPDAPRVLPPARLDIPAAAPAAPPRVSSEQPRNRPAAPPVALETSPEEPHAPTNPTASQAVLMLHSSCYL